MLCDAEGKLRGLITDGDIRRAVIRRIPLTEPCESIATPGPVCASEPISSSDALHLMNEHDIHQLPLVDGEGRIVDFLLRKDLLPQSQHDLQAVVMAGGYGKRLLPLTESVPKPMLPVGERPLLELIIHQLRKAGIHDVNLTTHYLPDSISGHFGNGEHFGVRLNYSREENPLGTAGGLRLMERPQGPFLVINGDILTGVPFQQMLRYHRSHQAMLTVGVRKYDMQVPFGVVECEDVRITRIEEKPSLSYFINAGTYLLEPAAWDRIPEGRTLRYDRPDCRAHRGGRNSHVDFRLWNIGLMLADTRTISRHRNWFRKENYRCGFLLPAEQATLAPPWLLFCSQQVTRCESLTGFIWWRVASRRVVSPRF